MIVAREERGTNVERGHGGWRMTVRLNTLMNVRRFFLLLMMTPVQMERMLATVRLPLSGIWHYQEFPTRPNVLGTSRAGIPDNILSYKERIRTCQTYRG